MLCWDTHLHDVDQYPVTHEPGQHVHHVEADRVHPEQSQHYPHHHPLDGLLPEEHVGGEWGERPGQHALGDGLQQDGVRHHGRPQLDPPALDI